MHDVIESTEFIVSDINRYASERSGNNLPEKWLQNSLGKYI